jgi:sulfite reductase (NADPH) flavoprotein alpha-component
LGTSTLPFGRPVSLASISGPTYVTAQLLVQQIAFKLSDKVFSYSPETFDLDTSARQWASEGASNTNIHGYAPSVLPLQTRTGAGALALGYIFSPDFDVSRRHIPQTLIAPSGSLQQLRGSLDQLSLLYGVSSPFVAHVAAADYSTSGGLVTNYDDALRLAEDLGLGLVASSSTYEAQHMSIFSTLLASLLPTLHIYDGVRMARETLRVVDALGESGVADLYNKLAAEASKLNPRLDTAGKALELLRLFNDELGTIYEPFEYHGHRTPDVVVVAFGSAETQVAKHVMNRIAAEGAKVGVVNVRLYRPFIEEAFLEVVPTSARTVVVLGQVKDQTAVHDEATQSALYGDVLTTVNFSDKFAQAPDVLDVKYTPGAAFNPQGLVDNLHRIFGNEGVAKALPSLIKAQQYTFWDVDDSVSVSSPNTVGHVLARESTSNIYLNETYDNLTQGGVVRTDLRVAKKALEAPYDIEQADVVVVSSEKLLKEVDVLQSVGFEAEVLLKLANFKEDEVDKRLPAGFRRAAHEKNIDLFVLDITYSPAFEKDPVANRMLTELAFLKLARPDINSETISQLVLAEGHAATLEECVDAVRQCLRKIDVPASWAEVDVAAAPFPASIHANSFVPFQKEDAEEVLELKDWQVAAKGLAFKEAYETQTSVRPDLPVATSTITVKENRRLTPLDYDRNIFHIEFDLGGSGLTYKIGEALGIHAENDEEEINEFISSYGLDPSELVQVPSREDPAGATEVRTVFQALTQNIDILGKPPKRFYEGLAEFARDETERKRLEALGSQAGAEDFKKRSDVDTLTYVDVLQEFASARPSFHDLVRIVSPLKRREYSIASAQAVTPTSVALMIVVVDWVDTKGRTRYGHASRYLSLLRPGSRVTASVKPSVMKLPTKDTAPLIMAGLGTGLAPFRAFVQYRAMQKAQGKDIGAILLYLGSRHQREEYLYGEEWEAYLAAGVVTLVGSAFSRDQPQKIYIQDRMRQTLDEIVKAYIRDEGSFYLCGPTWPVPDVTQVLQEAIAAEGKASGKKVDPKKEIDKLKEEGRYVLEVY